MVREMLSLISNPVTGQIMLPGHYHGPFGTILDPPNAILRGGKEHVMIIPVNQEHRKVLLKFPTSWAGDFILGAWQTKILRNNFQMHCNSYYPPFQQ
eukprot:scaffold25813_cov56-Attheya_sp.AAC.1